MQSVSRTSCLAIEIILFYIVQSPVEYGS